MKAKELLSIFTFVFAPAVSAFGQIDCTNSFKLACEVPYVTSRVVSTNSASEAAGQAVAGTSINAAFATQLTQLPIPSATVGIVTLQEKGNQFGKPFDNLGPILTDRPDTVGKGHLYGGFSFQHFDFDKLDGFHLGTLRVAYSGTQTTNGDTQTTFGTFYNNISFQLDQYVALLTYGVTRTTDISVVVPFNDVSLAVTTSNPQAYVYDFNSNNYSNDSFPGRKASTSGSASGVGDVAVSFKQLIHGIEGSKSAVAVGGGIRFPSGDKLNLLGSGAYGGNVYGIFSYRSRMSPHLKLSYQWNSSSVLVNPSTTTHTDNALPGGLQYDGGADFRVVPKVTIAGDILGSQFINTPSIAERVLALTPTPGKGIPAELSGATSITNTYTTVNLSAGVKWSPYRGLLLSGNVLLPLSDAGLHSNPAPLFGISYNLRIRK